MYPLFPYPTPFLSPCRRQGPREAWQDHRHQPLAVFRMDPGAAGEDRLAADRPRARCLDRAGFTVALLPFGMRIEQPQAGQVIGQRFVSEIEEAGGLGADDLAVLVATDQTEAVAGIDAADMMLEGDRKRVV